MKPIVLFAPILVWVVWAANALAADPFAENVRPTEALMPEQEQKSFHLPPGFEIQLVAAEPDILKPMNMAFDAQGRLWVTVTREYPFPVPPGKPARDQIKILSDFDEHGRARKITTFAEGLDIPIGIYPFWSPANVEAPKRDALKRESLPPAGVSTFQRFNVSTNLTWKCFVWSIPNIWLLEDTDGDGKADKQEKLYGPFGWERDTHGMNSSFARGFDGRLYATHCYNNNTDVRGADGHEVKMNSGNTYRFTLDGSRIEQNTWGQVNPFGLCFDALGNLYSADCHREPVYQLLRVGYYPSFGKPHDGLGFAPSMIFHGHGSTAISGIVYYEDDLWPEEYRNNIFTGNVMTSRVNRDAVTFTGSTPLANERPDFVVTDDPWFRPVNLQLGPDGALYIADFYNRIIGHYEVPLTHPGRDRTSGRIWRIVYVGQPSRLSLEDSTVKKKSETGKMPVLRPATLSNALDDLIAQLGSPNLTRRMLAMNAIDDQFGKSAVAKLENALDDTANEFQQSHILWLLHRLDAVKPAQLNAAHASRGVLPRVHAQRIAADTIYRDSLPGLPLDTDRIATAHAIAHEGLKDRDPLVQRCAAEAVGKINVITGDNVRALLDLLARVPKEDTHLLYTARKAVRDQLMLGGVFTRVLKTALSERDA